MADAPAGPSTGVGEHRLELRKEALTMALYVAICLLASLTVIPESTAEWSTRCSSSRPRSLLPC